MKYILLLALGLWVTAAWGQAEGIQFFHGSWDEALEKAKAEQKPIFVDAYASWCGPCKRMAAQVFPQKEVGELFNAKFINVKMDMEKGEGPGFAKKFPVRAYPTLLFITPQEEKFHEHVGGLDAEGLLKTGDLAVRKFGGNSEYAAMYKEGNREFEVVQGYLTGLANSGQSAVGPANEYLRGEGADLSDEERAEIAFAAATEADSRLFEMIVEDRDYLFANYPEEEILEKVQSACVATVDKAIAYKALFLIEEAVDKWYLFENDRTKRTAFEAGSYLRFHAAHDEWNAYENHLKPYLKTLPKGEVTERKRLAFEMVEAFGEPAYDSAKDLWQGVCDLEPDVADNHYRLARLYAVLGKGSKAQTAIEKAIELAADDGKALARYRAFAREL